MLNYIWGAIILISIVTAFFLGNTDVLSTETLNGASEGLELILTLLPMLVLWSGIMEIAQKSGLTEKIAKVFYPVLKRLFPSLKPQSEAFRCICLNISANLLGLGNAATPFGLRAMEELKKLSDDEARASNDMVLFVVMNTASIQIIPTTIGMLRLNEGSAAPFDILYCVWITSVFALVVGVTMAKIFNTTGNRSLR